jgi:hypothetical protein
MLCLPLTHSLTHDLSHGRARKRASERDQNQTEAGKGKRILTTTQQANAANAWIIKLGSLKKRNRHQKTNQNNSRIRLPQEFFDNHASFCTNDTKSSQIFFPSSSSSSCALLVSSSSRGSFVLVLVNFIFFFLFLGGPKNRQKITQFSENEIISVTNSLFLEKKTSPKMKHKTFFWRGRVSPQFMLYWLLVFLRIP